MAAPPVVVGLLVALFLTRNGPLGQFRLLVHALGDGHRPGHHRAAPSSWASRWRRCSSSTVGLRAADRRPGRRPPPGVLALLLREIKVALLAAVMAAFGGGDQRGRRGDAWWAATSRGRRRCSPGRSCRRRASAASSSRHRAGHHPHDPRLRRQPRDDARPAAGAAAGVSAPPRPLPVAGRPRPRASCAAGAPLVRVERFELAARATCTCCSGANGAGKSTLLKALNGLEEARRDARVRGASGRARPPRGWPCGAARRPSFRGRISSATSVLNNVASGLRLRGRCARDEARRRAAGGAASCSASPIWPERKPDRLSGGEAQR